MKTIARWNRVVCYAVLGSLLVVLPPTTRAALGSVGEGALWEQEEALDELLGLLGRPWTLIYHPGRTRAYLQERARATTGLPPYEQQVEHAGQSPAALFDRLTAPPPRTPVRRPPRHSPSPGSAPAPGNGNDGYPDPDPGPGNGNDGYPDPDPGPGDIP